MDLRYRFADFCKQSSRAHAILGLASSAEDSCAEIPRDSSFTDAVHAARKHNEDSVRTSHAVRSHPPSFYHPAGRLLQGTYRTRASRARRISLDGQQRGNLVRPSSFDRTK